MQYTSHYRSPMGDILLAADEVGLTGLWFEGQKYFALQLDKAHEEREIPLFAEVKRWLDTYFSGKAPGTAVPLHFTGTDFQNEVWRILTSIPYGQTTTYGQIARRLAAQRGRRTYPPKRWAARWGITAFLSLCPVTGLSARRALSPAMRAASRKSGRC